MARYLCGGCCDGWFELEGIDAPPKFKGSKTEAKLLVCDGIWDRKHGRVEFEQKGVKLGAEFDLKELREMAEYILYELNNER